MKIFTFAELLGKDREGRVFKMLGSDPSGEWLIMRLAGSKDKPILIHKSKMVKWVLAGDFTEARKKLFPSHSGYSERHEIF